MAMVRVSTNHRISTELVPKPIYPGSSREAPLKRKPENQDFLTTKPPTLTKGQRKRLEKDQERLDTKMKVSVKGIDKLLPYRKFGYDSNGNKNPDPSSTRQKLKKEALAKAKAGPPPPHPKGFGEGVQGLPTVKETFYPSMPDGKIRVLDGSNLRTLRDGLGMCSPGIITPGKDSLNLSGRS